MEYFNFDFNEHQDLIQSFLDSASFSHKIPTRDENWFLWKFRNNPYGKSILSCAKDGDKVIGCVAYGIQPFKLNNEVIIGAFAFENFVHPDYQRRGIFKKLIYNVEQECSRQGISFLMSVPNPSSLPGYLRMSWNKIQTPNYWIKPKKIFKICISLKSFKKGFISNKSNFEKLGVPIKFNQKFSEHLTPILSNDYLKWRFFEYPVGEYIFTKDENIFSIMRVGKRGKLLELQSLYLQTPNNKSFKLTSLLSQLHKLVNYDFVSFPISRNNKLGNYLAKNFFIKVPNKSNICFKILDNKRINAQDFDKISISAINYHTY